MDIPKPPPLPPTTCGHARRDDRTVIKLFAMVGYKAQHRLESITGGGRSLIRHTCTDCRNVDYWYRHTDGGESSSIGGDPEVVQAALLALIAQPTDTFALVAECSGMSNGSRTISYVLPRHHLPAFAVE